MLHVHRAERADRLVAALGDVLATPLEDPLATEVIAVHSRGIERWIAQELSLRLGTGKLGTDGVTANVEFPFPGRLVRRAVAAASGIDPEQDPWLPQRLAWPLLDLVNDDPDAPMLGPLGSHLTAGAPPTASITAAAESARSSEPTDEPPEGTDPAGSARRFGAVRHIADLFDRYGVHRPEMIAAWYDGEDRGADGSSLAPRHQWQPAMWRAVRDRVGLPSFAERRNAAITALQQDPTLVDLPSRFALFGLTALPATYFTVLAALAAHREVHLLLLHPSSDLWYRVGKVADASGPRLWAREEDPTRRLPRHPLLASWGRDVRELQLVAPPGAGPVRHHAAEASSRQPPQQPTTLLQRIQSDVEADRRPGGGGRAPLLNAQDRSLQVHACHGRLRQVEVLRDAILHLLVTSPDLQPRDIIVMCPDIETFAPLVTAVFGAEQVGRDDGLPALPGAPPALRVRLADRSLRRTNPVLEVTSLLLELVDGRVTASSVLDLVAREPVRRRFRFDDDEVELLGEWIEELQIRWGLDADHRRRQGLPGLDANSWRAGLTRLQLGMAMADEQQRTFAGIVPYDGVEGRTSDLAGRLVELIERLAAALEDMRGARPIDGWRDAIGAAADAVTATDRDHRWQRLQLHRILQDLVDEATFDHRVSPVELTLREVQSLLVERLAGRPTTTSHRTGDLTVCTLVPMRSVPHRVVCLLGLDDGAFPRQTVPDSDDLLLAAPRVGDRDLRSEDRQLLLDALLAATDSLVVTYAGRDVRSNEERPPAVPVDELLDVVDRTVATTDGRRPREHVLTRHPLQAHDPRNFAVGGLGPEHPDVWGFDPALLTAARASRGEPAPPRPLVTGDLALPPEDVIDLGELIDFLQHPVKAFVRHRLEVTLPGRGTERSDAIPASLEALDEWHVGDEMLRAWLAGDDLERAQELARARGLVPPGDLGRAGLTKVRERLERIVALCGHLELQPGPHRTVDVEVELLDGRTLIGTVPGLAADGWRLEAVRYSRVAPKHRLAAWASFLALSADDPSKPWAAATVGRHPWKKRGHPAQAVQLPTLRGPADEVRSTAVAELDRLVDLYDRGRTAPLPLYCATSAKVADNLYHTKDPMSYVSKEWETNDYAGFDHEDRDPYHLLVLGGQVQVDALLEELCATAEEASWAADGRRLVAYAWRLWEPILNAERKCEA